VEEVGYTGQENQHPWLRICLAALASSASDCRAKSSSTTLGDSLTA